MVQADGFWDDAQKAQPIMQERSQLESQINEILDLENQLTELVEMIEIAESEKEAALVEESEKELAALLKTAERQQLKSFLSGEADNNNAFLEVNAGAGGTEAQDWAEMLFRMYTRWAEKEKYKLEIVQEK